MYIILRKCVKHSAGIFCSVYSLRKKNGYFPIVAKRAFLSTGGIPLDTLGAGFRADTNKTNLINNVF